MGPNAVLILFQFLPVAAFFGIGCCIGSFLNVCILRLPEGLSIVDPPSRCPRCKKPLKWFDNIPLLSYLVLGGAAVHAAIRFPGNTPPWKP